MEQRPLEGDRSLQEMRIGLFGEDSVVKARVWTSRARANRTCFMGDPTRGESSKMWRLSGTAPLDSASVGVGKRISFPRSLDAAGNSPDKAGGPDFPDHRADDERQSSRQSPRADLRDANSCDKQDSRRQSAEDGNKQDGPGRKGSGQKNNADTTQPDHLGLRWFPKR